jgi:hypothetical protein
MKLSLCFSGLLPILSISAVRTTKNYREVTLKCLLVGIETKRTKNYLEVALKCLLVGIETSTLRKATFLANNDEIGVKP